MMASLTPLADSGDDHPRKPAKSLHKADPTGTPLLSAGSPLLGDVAVTLQARLGSVEMTLADLLALRTGSVIELKTRLSEPVELYLNDGLVARGEIVAVDDRFGIRILEIATR
jgi:flagellar motor switch protein FliN/FliY